MACSSSAPSTPSRRGSWTSSTARRARSSRTNDEERSLTTLESDGRRRVHLTRRLLFVVTALGLLGADATAIARGETQDPAVGWWRGYAVYEESRLDIAIHVLMRGATLEATLSSPDMMLLEQPLTGVQRDGRHFRFTTRDERPLRFDGLIEGDSIRGSAAVPPVPGVTKPGETTLRFVLGRTPAPGALSYTTREISFANGSVRLAGTLFVPESSGPHAAVVLLQGSSSNLRREYRFIADHFARTGLVVLAFDKRGNGESSGDYSAATYQDLVGDACAAITCLSAQREVDVRRVGVWGLSQGAFIAPSVAAHVPSLRFIVAVSAPGMPIGECAAYQDSVRLVSAGFGPADVRQAVSLDRSILEWLR